MIKLFNALSPTLWVLAVASPASAQCAEWNDRFFGAGVDQNVRAIAVCPGTTATEFFRRAGSRGDDAKSSFSMSPDAVVKLAFRAMARGRSQIVTGWGNKMYTFAGARLPKPLSARVAGKILSRRRPISPGA